MGRILVGLLILTLSTVYSSAYHQYHHYNPRDLYDEYHSAKEAEHSAEDPAYEVEVDEPNVHEELTAADPVYDVPNVEAEDLNAIPLARANAPSNGYEVTEDVDDIPNPEEEFRPIVANYSRPKPLNFARPNNTNSHSNIVEREIDDKKGINHNKINNSKHKNHNRIEQTHEDLSFSEIFPDAEESFEGVKNGFEKHLNGFKDKVFKTLNEPMDYLDKLHGKAKSFLSRLNELFGYEHEKDEDEFETF